MSVRRFEFDGGVAVCNDCGNEFDCGTGMLEDDDGKFVFYDDYEKLESELAALKEKLRWISVSERLPEIDAQVECAYDVMPTQFEKHRIIFIGGINDFGDWEFISPDGLMCKSCIPIMYWREVPEL